MAFRGTINTNGRPKGSNKNTKLIKDTFAELLENNTEELLKRINNLSDKDYVKFHIDIAKMLLPKPTEVKVTMGSSYYTTVIRTNRTVILLVRSTIYLCKNYVTI